MGLPLMSKRGAIFLLKFFGSIAVVVCVGVLALPKE